MRNLSFVTSTWNAARSLSTRCAYALAILAGSVTVGSTGIANAAYYGNVNVTVVPGTTQTIAIDATGSSLQLTSPNSGTGLYNGTFWNSSLSASSSLGVSIDTSGPLSAGTPIDASLAFGAPTLNSATFSTYQQIIGYNTVSCGLFCTRQVPVYGTFGSQGGNAGALGTLIYGMAVQTAGGTEYGWVDVSVAGGPGGYTATVNSYGINGTAGTTAYAPPVPVPAAAWLFSSAIGGLGFLARKRKAS